VIGRDTVKKSEKPSRVREPNLYKPYYSNEFRDVVKYIQEVFKKKVYLIGIRALFERGVPVWRFTDDFDVYTPLNKDERDKIIAYVREKYEKSKHVWSKFGFALDFEPIGHIDINIIPPSIYDETWEEDVIRINDVNVYLPPLEDILIMKLLSPRIKDRKDVGVALRLGRDKIDFERLKAKAERAGVTKKLVKVAKRYAVSLN
jgi:hypothetical protein